MTRVTAKIVLMVYQIGHQALWLQMHIQPKKKKKELKSSLCGKSLCSTNILESVGVLHAQIDHFLIWRSQESLCTLKGVHKTLVPSNKNEVGLYYYAFKRGWWWGFFFFLLPPLSIKLIYKKKNASKPITWISFVRNREWLMVPCTIVSSIKERGKETI